MIRHHMKHMLNTLTSRQRVRSSYRTIGLEIESKNYSFTKLCAEYIVMITVDSHIQKGMKG